MKKKILTLLMVCSFVFVALFGGLAIYKTKSQPTLTATYSQEYEYLANREYVDEYVKTVALNVKAPVYTVATTHTTLSFIGEWFDSMGEVLTEVIDFMVNLFNGAIALVWDSAANEGAGEITVIGIFMLIGVVIGIFWLGFRLIRNLTRMRG